MIYDTDSYPHRAQLCEAVITTLTRIGAVSPRQAVTTSVLVEVMKLSGVVLKKGGPDLKTWLQNEVQAGRSPLSTMAFFVADPKQAPPEEGDNHENAEKVGDFEWFAYGTPYDPRKPIVFPSGD